MPWWTWIALGVFIASLVAASVIALLTMMTLRSLQATSERLAAALEELAAKGEALERRSDVASAHVESAEPHFEHLKLTLDRFSVLTWALGVVAPVL